MATRWRPPAGLFHRDPEVVTYRSIEGPPLTEAMVETAERVLGLALPVSYLDLMRVCNGGYLTIELGCPTSEPTTWAPDHVGLSAINGIPATVDVDPADPFQCMDGILCTPYMTREWGLPDGLVLLDGDGHTWIALDYRASGDDPPVAWLDVDENQDLRIAPDFATFVDTLRPFDTPE